MKKALTTRKQIIKKLIDGLKNKEPPPINEKKKYYTSNNFNHFQSGNNLILDDADNYIFSVYHKKQFITIDYSYEIEPFKITIKNK